MKTRIPLSHRGATAVEFALVLVLFLTFLLGVIDFSRMMFMWNAATEATRAGARYAVVCDDTFNDPAVLARMQALMPQIQQVQIDWQPQGCTAATCEGVTVSINQMTYQWISPIAAIAGPLAMPKFSTFLTREVMRQDPHSATLCS